MGLNHANLSRRYFFPRTDPVQTPWWVEVPGARLACYRSAPRQGRPWVLVFHGNGEVVADYVPDFTSRLEALGVGVALAEYRGYGGSTGVPTLPSLLDDAEAVLRALGRPSEVVVFGRSVGSIPAIELAGRHPDLAGLVLESGIADVLERVKLRVRPEDLGLTAEELDQQLSARFDHRAKLGAYRGPVRVLHAEHDDLVDASHAKRNASWAAGKDVELHLLPYGDHNTIQVANHAAYWQVLGTFLSRLVPPSST